jgi:ankyrin repeat protein
MTETSKPSGRSGESSSVLCYELPNSPHSHDLHGAQAVNNAMPMNGNDVDSQAALPNTQQTNSRTRTIKTDYGLDFDSASTIPSAQLSPSSQMTVSSGSSSLASLDRRRSATQEVNVTFIDATKNGDTVLLLAWISKSDIRSMLDQKSINVALIELSKNMEHGSRRLEAVNVLLDKCTPDLEYRDTQHNCTPLIWAVYFGREAIVKLLIGKGASLEAVDRPYKRTPLLWAAFRGSLKAAELLLEPSQERQLIHAKDVDGNTALALAYAEKHMLIAKALLHYGADPNLNIKSGPPLLVSAIEGGDEDFVRLLVAKGADVQCLRLDGVPALSVAVYDKSLAMIQLLIDNEANVQASDPQGRTPLIWAIKRCRDDVVKLLINEGANTNVADSDGLTAQYWAQRTKREKIIGLMCQEV